MDRMRMPSFPAESFFHYEVVDPLPTVARLNKMSDQGMKPFLRRTMDHLNAAIGLLKKHGQESVHRRYRGGCIRRKPSSHHHEASCRILRYAYYDAYVVDWLPCVHQL